MNNTRIVCYGDSNTWGYNAAGGGTRFEDAHKWTYWLSQNLGSGYKVESEGLCGRTTAFEDPINEGLSGIAHLSPILSSHNPIDLLIIMLGTNDCKQRFSATPKNIADALRRLVKKAKSCEVWRSTPNILIVAPIIIDRKIYTVPLIGESMGKDCAEKSERLPALMKATAIETNCHFMDCNPYVTPNTTDYMHFDSSSGKVFAEALTVKVKEILSSRSAMTFR